MQIQRQQFRGALIPVAILMLLVVNLQVDDQAYADDVSDPRDVSDICDPSRTRQQAVQEDDHRDARHLLDIKDTVKRSFKVRAGGTLYLDIDHGNVVVEPHSGGEVFVEVERTVQSDNRDDAKRILDRHDLSMEERNNDVHIESRTDRDGGFWGRMSARTQMKVRVQVRVPERYSVEFTSGAGNVAVGTISGRVDGRTGAGNIEIGAVDGSVDVASGSGNIDIKGALGRVEANTGAGNIHAREVRGEVEINTGAGNIEVYITRQPQADSRLHTGAGNVTVFLGSAVGVQVDAEASVGSASSDYPLAIEGKWMTKRFSGDVNGGGPDLHLRAGVGNVALRKM